MCLRMNHCNFHGIPYPDAWSVVANQEKYEIFTRQVRRAARRYSYQFGLIQQASDVVHRVPTIGF